MRRHLYACHVHEHRTRLRLFVASPSDTTEERSCIARVVRELHNGVADEVGMYVDAAMWETHA
jgi:hypothetical protein